MLEIGDGLPSVMPVVPITPGTRPAGFGSLNFVGAEGAGVPNELPMTLYKNWNSEIFNSRPSHINHPKWSYCAAENFISPVVGFWCAPNAIQ